MYVSRKAHNLPLKQCEKHLSRHSVWARLAIFSTWLNTARHHVERLQSPGPHCPTLAAIPEYVHFLDFSCNSRSAGTVISKMSALKLLMADDRRFLPENSQPVEVIATLPLHWRTFHLACFPQKNHSSLSSKSPSSPPQETIAPSSFNSRRSTLQLRLSDRR